VHSEEGWDFAGALFAGSPVPLLGHNRTLGWTNTVNMPDLVDLYQLTVKDSAGAQWYRMDGEWKPLVREEVKLRVRVAGVTVPVKRVVYRSGIGPVLRTKRGYIAVKVRGDGRRAAGDGVLPAHEGARPDGSGARRSPCSRCRRRTSCTRMRRGHIAYVYNALFPRRRGGFDWSGIVPGDTSATAWDGYVPFDSIPQVIDPPSGFLMNANNTPFRATDAASDLRRGDFPLVDGDRTADDQPGRCARWSCCRRCRGSRGTRCCG
jgi:acyl-homoserine-lactone acylase